jgi:tRNA-splicing ligase RtcB
MSYEIIEGPNPIKAWTRGVEIDEKAKQQLRNLASLPFVFKHVAVMPDVHWGLGATVGSVIATKGAIIPAAVGVDIGCGMMAQRTSLTASDLPDSLAKLRSAIESAVPHGRSDNGGANDVGSWRSAVDLSSDLARRLKALSVRHPMLARSIARAGHQMGTLGTGNHFVEICLDEAQRVWVMLHSGSRGVGNRIGTYFIEKAKEEMRRRNVSLPDADLAWLPEDSPLFHEYVEAVAIAQDYALANRERMMAAVLAALRSVRPFTTDEVAVNCHHNYVTRENHFEEDVLVTRKGAVCAREGVLGIIPGSMGAKSFIVRGKGNTDSFHSCSHGAGRRHSRGQAKKLFTLDDHAKATAGVECRKDAGVIDETPAAYKDIDAVMAAQSDLVEVVHTLKQVLCVKG